MNFSINMEVIAALMILLLLLYSFDERNTSNAGNRRYHFCLYVSLASIAADLLSVWGINCAGEIPVWINMVISSVNYLLASFMAVVSARYVSYHIFVHFPRHFCRKRIETVITALYLVVVAAVVLNLFTGCLFSFKNGMYYRGPLNLLGYVAVMGEVAMVGMCYIKNIDIAGDTMRRAMRSIPYVVCAMVALQLVYRDVMMNGMIAAVVDMILFVSFQSSSNGRDYLTNLGNRRSFVHDLTAHPEKKNAFHVVMLGLNQFGRINREFGQKNGDEFLYAVARYLDNFSANSMAYRLGSLEFAIICHEEPDGYQKTVSDIQERFAHAWEIGEMKAWLSISLADICCDGTSGDGTQIIEQLEYTLNIAKASGGSRWVHFDSEIKQMMVRQKYLIEQMRNAIVHKSFEVYYQPIYCWKDGLFCSAEALARLFDQEGNLISPAEFIPLAETTGMIKEISWIIVEKICCFIGSHPELQIKGITINMSMQQFLDDEMEKTLEDILSRYGVSYEIIKIEITERIISEDPDKTKKIMESLTKKGVCFYLDDFGTGYSNFSSVLSLPFDTIKLDKSLTDRALGTENERLFIRSIVNMFLESGYSIVAEGAETEEIVEELKRLHVDRIQGFYYSRPLPGEEYLKFMNRVKENK